MSCVIGRPRTRDRSISHWRALCLLAVNNWRCSIQPGIFPLVVSMYNVDISIQGQLKGNRQLKYKK